jgi:hypothetical protein
MRISPLASTLTRYQSLSKRLWSPYCFESPVWVAFGLEGAGLRRVDEACPFPRMAVEWKEPPGERISCNPQRG